MKSYVDIKTFFQSDEERTVENLRRIYDNPKLLCESIRQVMLPHLSPEQIKGKRILLKPNFVMENKKKDDDICMTTHPNFILATLMSLLECCPRSIVIGDAPIQNCRWDLLISAGFKEKVEDLSKTYDIPIKIIDFRKVIYYPSQNTFGRSPRAEGDYLIFDVAEKSWLEPITTEDNKFRVTNYNPDMMALSHSKGMHKYCVAREVFEADIVITIPKPKTHRMACLTNSLKVLVGINGDKDYLPHHRIGSVSSGGDCYKYYNLFRSWAESLRDVGNRKRGSLSFRPLMSLAGLFWKMGRPNNEVSSNAGWYGNDTVWRMVMDINVIAQYGTLDGSFSENPQRTIYSLCDGIIGGQGSGPLNPIPLALGLILFSNDSYLLDEIMGYIFSLNIQKVPLLREAAGINKTKENEIIINGVLSNMEDIRNLSTSVILPPGWQNYNNQ